jgi:hypothetical protein
MTDRLEPLLREAAARIGTESSCSVILRLDGTLSRVASSDERAAACDDAEVAERAGPCVLALDQLSGVLVPDAADERRWPGWVQAVQEVGFRSGAALPAYVGGGVAVALNLYSDRLDPWDADALVTGDRYAQEVAEIIRARGLG